MKFIKLLCFVLLFSGPLASASVENEANWQSILKRINYKMLNVDWRQSSVHDFDSPLYIDLDSSFETLDMGDFFINITNSPSAQISIFHKANPQRPVFQSRAGQSFIRAGVGEANFEQHRGSFTINDKKQSPQCLTQTITGFKKYENEAIFEGNISGFNCQSAYKLIFSQQSDRRLRFSIEMDNKQLNRTFLVYSSEPEEAFFGFGEQFTHINLKGKKVPIFAQEQGHLRGLMPFTFFVNRISPGAAGAWFSTYTAIPQYVTNLNRGLFLENYEFSLFDLSGKNEVAIRIFKNGLEGQILAGENPLELVEAFTEYSGRMKPLPDWMHRGAIVGLMGGSDRVRELYQRLQVNRVPVSGLWIQDWVGKRDTGLGIRMWWNWELDKNSYPDWHDLINELHADDVKVLGYVNPYLADASSKEGVEKNFFEIAKERNYLTTWENGQPAEIDSGGFTGTLLDLSNQEARQWMKDELVSTFKELKFSGWMADFGEALPMNAYLANADSASFHNKYLESWAELNTEIADEMGDDIVYFSRNASIKSPGVAKLFWAGDQMVTWDEHDGLKSSLAGIISGGFSGMSLNHSDIGGLISMKRNVMGIEINFTRDQELLLRWAEMNVFSPVYRNHEGNNPAKNHQFYTNHKTFKGFAYFARLFSLFFEYRKHLMQEAYEKGYPMMRHLIMHFPEDKNIMNYPYQFMFGSDFLIAPVTKPGAQNWDVYLPRGEWVHLFSNEEYSLESGKVINVSAKLGQPPVFYKKESQFGRNVHEKIPTIGAINFPYN